MNELHIALVVRLAVEDAHELVHANAISSICIITFRIVSLRLVDNLLIHLALNMNCGRVECYLGDTTSTTLQG